MEESVGIQIIAGSKVKYQSVGLTFSASKHVKLVFSLQCNCTVPACHQPNPTWGGGGGVSGSVQHHLKSFGMH